MKTAQESLIQRRVKNCSVDEWIDTLKDAKATGMQHENKKSIHITLNVITISGDKYDTFPSERYSDVTKVPQ